MPSGKKKRGSSGGGGWWFLLEQHELFNVVFEPGWAQIHFRGKMK